MALQFPNIDPVILTIPFTPFSITWYALAYVVGILLAWKFIQKLNIVEPKIIDNQQLENLVSYVIIGILLGGRIGYVLFYNFDYYLEHPLEILQTWTGGMSFHGGLVGVILAIWLFVKKNNLNFFKLTDQIACCAPIGIFLGRMANFIRGELFGRKTDLPWGIIFPGQNIARHPSQIYEALTEGLLILIILNFCYFKTKFSEKSGIISGLFLLLYSFFRLILENFREPDPQLGLVFYHLTMGQILTLPMIFAALIIIYYAWYNKC